MRIVTEVMTTAFAVERPTPSAPASVTKPSYEQMKAMAPPNNTALSNEYTTWKVPNPSRTPSMKSDFVTSVAYTATAYPLNRPVASARMTSAGNMTRHASSRGTMRNASGSYDSVSSAS